MNFYLSLSTHDISLRRLIPTYSKKKWAISSGKGHVWYREFNWFMVNIQMNNEED